MYYYPSTLKAANPVPLPALLRSATTASGAIGAGQPQQTWLVPVDGTRVSMLAVEYVIAHADNARTRIHLLNVQPAIMTGHVSVLASAKLVADLRRSVGELAVRNAQRLLSQHGFEHSCEVVFGAPAEAIVRSAAERGCTKIVMSARRTGALARIMGRSVSNRVVRLSHVTVTIVKAGREQQAAYMESMPCVTALAAR